MAQQQQAGEQQEYRAEYHVVKRGPASWAIQKRGAGRATLVESSQESARQIAHDLAQGRAPSRVIVHDADGSVADEQEFGVGGWVGSGGFTEEKVQGAEQQEGAPMGQEQQG